MKNSNAERLLKSVIVHRPNEKTLRSLKAMEESETLLTVMTTWKIRGLAIGETLIEWIESQINVDKLMK